MTHYFSSGSPDLVDPAEIEVTLRGRRVTVTTDRGVFSGDRLDPGTAVLLETVPDPPSGTLLDLGCGWGPIAIALAQASPAARVLAVDVNPRALTLTARNAAATGCAVEVADPEALLAAEPDLVLDALWSNPPIRIGKEPLHAMLRTWLPRLRPDGGAAHLVVSKNLGADSLARWVTDDLGLVVEKIASRKGFRVLRVSR